VVDEPTWRAYYCADTSASGADILEAIAYRFSLEITSRECKQAVGAGQQHMRSIWPRFAVYWVTYAMDCE